MTKTLPVEQIGTYKSCRYMVAPNGIFFLLELPIHRDKEGKVIIVGYWRTTALDELYKEWDALLPYYL
jgi:hypothetical protein